ncbi:MAG: dihydrodipicolinate synthase family protein [Hyphomicrobiaceae bacterium]
MTDRPYRGVWPVAPTPFTNSGALDLGGMRRVLDCMIDQGVDGICILANYSEQFVLSDEERETLMRLCLLHVAGRVPVIVTCSHFSTKIVVDRCIRAKDNGAAMIMLMPPYHGTALRGSPAGTMEQFKRASDVGLPIMVQDAPLSGVDLSVDFLARMARDIENVSYFKIETTQAASKLRGLISAGGEAVKGPFDGEEGITLLADLDAGATGTMTSALLSEHVKPVVAAHRAGHRQEAERRYNRILPLINYENRQCGLRACKAVMKAGGVIGSDYVRHPLAPLDDPIRDDLLRLAREYDLVAMRWGK